MEKKKMTREEVIAALKKAIAHKEEARKRTEKEFRRLGIEGKVVSL